MKVLFDHQIFVNQNYGGISRYFYELYKRFPLEDAEGELLLKFTNNAYLKNEGIRSFFPNQQFKGKQRAYNYLNENYAKKKLRQGKYDILHPTYFDDYFLKNIGSKPFIVTFYDMIHERLSYKYTELATDKRVLENKYSLAEKASKIIAISEATKNDMVEIMGIDESKIDVVYLGSSFDASIATKKSMIEGKYLLYVGNRSIYKNFVFFIESIHSLLKSKGLLLVCAGGGPLNDAELNLINRLKIIDHVTQLNIDDYTLASLYKHAEAFVFPSLYEGFGIPILEAFACECPCIASDVSSLPEVGGEAVAYFNPNDSLSILSVVSNVISSKNVQDNLRAAGNKRLSQFSWDKTFIETLNIYKNVL